MSNAFGVNGSSTPTYVPSTGFDATVTTMSPDALLEYCRMQLGDLDGQVTTQMNAQKLALRQREAVQSAQTAFEKFGTDGPRTPPEMGTCVTAIDNAIAQLPPNDPTAAKLAEFRKEVCDQYQFTPGRPLTQSEQFELNFDEATLSAATTAHGGSSLQSTIDSLHKIENGVFKAPNKDAKEWQATVDTLSTAAADIKSNAEIQMLQLQDLVSQRQQAVQLASGMMNKEDQTLEGLAKAIGQ
jgi:hypothetical protein